MDWGQARLGKKRGKSDTRAKIAMNEQAVVESAGQQEEQLPNKSEDIHSYLHSYYINIFGRHFYHKQYTLHSMYTF